MDYLIHTYPKPIVCFGNGFVMGGGMGLMAGCSHRIVTERTRNGDAGNYHWPVSRRRGTWFLSRMPAGMDFSLIYWVPNAMPPMRCPWAGLMLFYLRASLTLFWSTEANQLDQR